MMLLDDDPMPPDPLKDTTCVPVVVVTPKERAFYLSLRQGLLIQLGALEDFLGLERSVIPRHKREDAYARRS